MSKIKLTGSNSGYVEIDSAADAGNLTLSLPTSGTRLLSNTDNVFSGITTTAELDINGKIDVSTDAVIARNLSVGGITTHTGTTTLSDDVTFTGGSYNVVWDKSDNQLEFGDNAKLSFGAAADMQLYHDGSHSRIVDSGTGNLKLQGSKVQLLNADNSKEFLHGIDGGGVTLRHNNNVKLVTDGSGVTVTGTVAATSFSGDGSNLTNLSTPLSFRNKIINGSMTVFQRGVGTNNYSSSHDGYYAGIADRWAIRAHASMGTQTYDQNTNSPNNFGHSQRIYTTGADGGNAGKYYVYDTRLEGRDLQDFEKGTSTAKQFTLSFYVKCNINRVFTCELRDLDNGRLCVQQYTTTNSNWNRYVLTFPADTTGKFDDDNNASLWVRFWLSAGFNFKSGTSQTTWGSANDANICPGQTGDLGGRVGDYWYITGIQLEVGDTATPYEHRSFHDELLRCYRYYNKKNPCYGRIGQMYTNSAIAFTMDLPCEMRASPTITNEGGLYFARQNGLALGLTGINHGSTSTTTARISLDVNSNGDNGESAFIWSNSTYYILDAEL
tara:strand:+ start:3039 stop:4694 length:1656 start_codon:yes stop_codon:yes gene_type:complete